jgi:ketosteroid isomerase-like protein
VSSVRRSSFASHDHEAKGRMPSPRASMQQGYASTGKTAAEANQELFIFKKSEDGEWRIARYSFSPTNPPGS